MTTTHPAIFDQPATLAQPATRTGPRPAVTRLTIAEAAERTGLTTHTLRYYERDGLMLRAVERTSSGHRAYGEGDLVWITLLTCLRATGMPIREVKVYAELVRSGEGNELVRLDLLETHRARVLAQLAEVTSHLGAIDNKIGVYSAKLEAAGIDLDENAAFSPSAEDTRRPA